MAVETEIAEVFACPVCGKDNYVVWVPREARREIACVYHFHEEVVDQPSVDQDGSPIIIQLRVTKGDMFTVRQAQGVRVINREREEGRGWTEKGTAVIPAMEV